jgi:hypothetical protein
MDWIVPTRQKTQKIAHVLTHPAEQEGSAASVSAATLKTKSFPVVVFPRMLKRLTTGLSTNL